MPKVSVVVPVFNPGAHIDDCISSLLGQSMPSEQLELIFVDDGSTDATPERLRALADEHPHVQVARIPNSGWPGRPRNVGLDMAKGEYVYFVDNDDWLGEEALERLYAMARADDADIVIGKVVGHGKRVPPQLFRRNRHALRLDSAKLLVLLTPHKLFRRSLLDEHGVRFVEGRGRLEDHKFVVEALLRAERISVLADYPCYHWVLRDPQHNASFRQFDAAGYYEDVREVLDIVERHTEPGPLQDELVLHWYRGKMLGRVGGRGWLNRDPAWRRELHAEVRRLAGERFDRRLDAQLPFALRVRARLLRDGTYEDLEALAAVETAQRARVRLRSLATGGEDCVVRVSGGLMSRHTSLRFERDGERVRWRPPRPLRGRIDDEALDVTAALPMARVELYLHGADGVEFFLPTDTQVRLRGRRGRLRAELAATARIDPRTAAGGAPLPDGRWELRARVTLVGYADARRVRRLGRPVGVTCSDGRLDRG